MNNLLWPCYSYKKNIQSFQPTDLGLKSYGKKTQNRSLKVAYRTHTKRLRMFPIVIKVVYFDGFTLFCVSLVFILHFNVIGNFNKYISHDRLTKLTKYWSWTYENVNKKKVYEININEGIFWASYNYSKLGILWFFMLYHISNTTLQSMFSKFMPHNDTHIKMSKFFDFNELCKWFLRSFY